VFHHAVLDPLFGKDRTHGIIGDDDCFRVMLYKLLQGFDMKMIGMLVSDEDNVGALYFAMLLNAIRTWVKENPFVANVDHETAVCEFFDFHRLSIT